MNRHLYLTINIGGEEISQNAISGLSLVQPMGGLHRFSIQLRQDAIQGLLASKGDNFIGKPISVGYGFPSHRQLAILPPPERFRGIVTEVSLSRQSGKSLLMISGHCPCISLTDYPIARSFTDKTLSGIVNEILQPVQGNFSEISVKPEQFTSTIPYTVQYNETNWAYLLRLANWYGEWCYYDGLGFHFGGDPSANESVRLLFGHNSLKNFKVKSRTKPGKFKFTAYDYEVAQVNDSVAPGAVKSNKSGQVAIDRSNSEVFSTENVSHLPISLPEGELKRLSKRSEQISQGDVTVAVGSSRNAKLKLGTVIDVEDDDIMEAYGKFVITNISHSITSGGEYSNNFEAVSVEAKTPAIKTAIREPKCANQIARVTNVADEKSLGRVKVKLPFQEGTDEESPWIRVCTPYMGGEKGFYVIPEVDDQVLVGFEGDHPDYPYILTGMYHGKAKPQWFDAGNRYKGIQTRGNNILKMDDDSQHILFSAPSSMDIFAGGTINIKTGGKEDSSITIDTGEGTINISAKTINIVAAETIYVESGKVIEAKSNETFDLSAGKAMTASAIDSLDISSKAVAMAGNQSVEVKGSKVDVKGSGTVGITGATVKVNG